VYTYAFLATPHTCSPFCVRTCAAVDPQSGSQGKNILTTLFSLMGALKQVCSMHACVCVCMCVCVCVCVCVCAGLGVRCRYMQEVVGFSYASLNQARHLLIAQLLNPTSSTQTIHTHTHPVSQPHVEISNSCSACIFPTLHNLAPISHSTVKMLKLTLKLLYITLDDVCLRWHWHT